MLIAGCSNTSGSEIDGSGDSVYNREHSYGNLLAKKLGYEPINIAIAGSTNSGIVRSVIDWINNEYVSDTELFVLVGWTDSNRMEIPFYQKTMYKERWDNYVDYYSNTHDDYVRIIVGWTGITKKQKEFIERYHKFMVNNSLYLEIISANQVMQLQYFLKMQNIKYLFVNTQTMFDSQNVETTDWYKNQIDSTCFLNFYDNRESFYPKYANLGYKNAKAQYYHHDEVPHRLYADHLYDYIIKNNLHTTYK